MAFVLVEAQRPKFLPCIKSLRSRGNLRKRSVHVLFILKKRMIAFLETRDVPSRVRVIKHYSDSAESEYELILGRVLNHYHFDLFLLFIRIWVEIRTSTDVMTFFFLLFT